MNWEDEQAFVVWIKGFLLGLNYLIIVHAFNGLGRGVEETCSKTAWPVCNDREGHQMSGHLHPS